MLRIGLTGGIGSGKTTVAHIFETLGIPVYFADDAAKNLMASDVKLRKSIIEIFGEESYKGTAPNRSFLAAAVFGNKEKLAQLNALIHPATIADAVKWMEQQHAPYAIKEAALIFESGVEKFLDKVIGVYAPEKLRMQRVMERDQLSEEQIRLRMAQQMNEEEKINRCDFVIQNDEKHSIIRQVLEIDKILRNSCNSRFKD